VYVAPGSSRRTPVSTSGGSPAPELSVPVNTYQCQAAWGRERGFPPPISTTSSEALDVTIEP
jgi:hypothetical protein